MAEPHYHTSYSISSPAQIKCQYSIASVTIIYVLHRNKSLILILTLVVVEIRKKCVKNKFAKGYQMHDLLLRRPAV